MTDREFRSILKPVREERFPIGFLALVRQSHSKKLRFFPSSFSTRTKKESIMYSEYASLMKGKLFSSIEEQCAFWKTVHHLLRGDIDRKYLERIRSVRLNGYEPFFYEFVLPKFERVFGKNQPGIFMDLRMIELLRTRFCKDLSFTLFNDCLVSGKLLLTEKGGYEAFNRIGECQNGDFTVFRMQLGHTHPYHDERLIPAPLLEGEFFPPLGVIVAVFCSQLNAIWSIDQKWWIACPGSGTKTGYGEDKGGDSIPCLEYYDGLCQTDRSVNIIPLKVLFDSEGSHREKEGGFASIIAPTT